MRLDINLATQPYEDARQFWLRWGGAIGVLGILTLMLVFSAVSGWRSAAKDRSMIRERQARIASLEQKRKDAEAILNQPENRGIRDQSEFLNGLFQRKAFSWTKAFEDLERVMPGRLHVVSIKPELTPEHQLAIKLSVAGSSRDSAIELVRRMEASQHFQQTQIDVENVTTGQNPDENVKFDISALYVPEIKQSVAPGAK